MTFNKFFILYSLILFLLFQSHHFFLDLSKNNSNLIQKSYIFFYLFSILFFLLIYLKAKKNSQLAGVYLFGSVVKLVAFFFIFRPIIYRDNFIDKHEISIFLIPYIFSYAFMIFFISKLMVNPN